ncbi:MAG: hypothetical protein KAU21_04430 [Gammaproteobacteria bacterium]|nr:hypothetical protein [Gammaproteobacteria bacterium]
MKLRLILPIALLSSLSLISCGGGDGSDDEGTTGVAVISTDNEQALATAATEAAKAAVNYESAPSFGSKSASKSYDFALVQDFSSFCITGTASMDVNETTGNGVFTYSNCDMDGGAVVNGTVNFSTTVAGDISTTTTSYNNFTMVYAGETQSFDMTMVCTTNISTQTFSCTYESDNLGIDGRTYSVSGSSVSGDAFGGYTVSATVTDPDHGTLSITTNTPITFNCDNGQPDSGEIQFTDGDGNTVVVTYVSCSSFTVSYNGTSNPYSW